MKKHPQKYLYLSYESRRVAVDEDMVPIVLGLEKLGIRTSTCCQQDCGGFCKRKHKLVNRPKWRWTKGRKTKFFKYRKPKACQDSAYITFPDPENARMFMQIIYRETDPERVRHHMLGIGSKRSKRWGWFFHVQDENNFWMLLRSTPKKFELGSAHINFWPCVTFPRSYLPLIIERVQETVEKKVKKRSKG